MFPLSLQKEPWPLEPGAADGSQAGTPDSPHSVLTTAYVSSRNWSSPATDGKPRPREGEKVSRSHRAGEAASQLALFQTPRSFPHKSSKRQMGRQTGRQEQRHSRRSGRKCRPSCPWGTPWHYGGDAGVLSAEPDAQGALGVRTATEQGRHWPAIA